MFISSVSRFALAAAVAVALSGLPQLAMAKSAQMHDIHFVKTVSKSSP